MKRRTAVLGATGQLGGAMLDGLGREYELIPFTRTDLDLADPRAIAAALANARPAVILNCAAFTQVDAAEEQPAAALTVNAWAVRSIAHAAAELNATLVHFSTDFVFDGATDRPYVETDAANPRGSYAGSKLLGEWFAAQAPCHYVLRVESLFGGPRARSSVDHIVRGLRAGTAVRAFVDRTVSPSYVRDVVTATDAVLRRGSPFGLYHCVNSGWTTWAGLAREIAARLGERGACIEEVRMSDAGLRAMRPQFAALSNEKLCAAGVEMPTWQDAIGRYLQQL